MDKNIARAIIIASAVRSYDKRFGLYVYRKYVERAFQATGLNYNICSEDQIQEIDKAESVYHFSLLGTLNRWLKENGISGQSRIPENTLGEALEFLVKAAPAI